MKKIIESSIILLSIFLLNSCVISHTAYKPNEPAYVMAITIDGDTVLVKANDRFLEYRPEYNYWYYLGVNYYKYDYYNWYYDRLHNRYYERKYYPIKQNPYTRYHIPSNNLRHRNERSKIIQRKPIIVDKNNNTFRYYKPRTYSIDRNYGNNRTSTTNRLNKNR